MWSSLLSIFFTIKVFRFDGGHVTLFECKWLFSVYIHHLAMDVQDRFHTHAFNSVSFILWGGYTEVVKRGMGDAPTYHLEFQAPAVRYIPRGMNHKLLCARPNTVSLIITGPYADM